MNPVLSPVVLPRSGHPAAALKRATGRLDSLDAWRGLIIMLMVLDHVRDFFHVGALAYHATDPQQTTAILYLTRWITHLCAPTFIFLAGIAIRLQRDKANSASGLPGFLLARGVWLIALEFTVIGFGFNMGGPFFFVQVMYAIGISMICMAGLVRLPGSAVLALGILLVGIAPALIALFGNAHGALALLGTLTVLPGPLPGGAGMLLYPFVPWLGVMCLGYGYGPVFQLPRVRRNAIVAGTAVFLLLAFVRVRAFNSYGDLVPWKVWPEALQTIEAFLNVTKYPATPDYVMVTLGASLLLFLMLDHAGAIVRPLLTFGRTPLFTYVVHIYVAHGAQIAIGLALGYPLATMTNFMSQAFDQHGGPPPLVLAGWGAPLWAVYVIWVLILAAIYPLSRWFGGVKRRRHDWWIRFL